MKKSFKNTILISIIFLCFVLLLFDTLNNAPWEVLLSWRQSDTYSIAEIYKEEGINLSKPKFFYDGAEKNIVQLELQILPALGVLISNIFKFDIIFSLRLISVLFFLGSAIFMYLTASLYMKSTFAIFSMAVYMLTPLSLFLSRAIMPESAALFFYLGGVYFIFMRFKTKKKSYAYISAIFMAFAILEKIPTAFFGLAVIFYYLKEKKLKAIKSVEFYLYGIIALLPAICYFGYTKVKSVSNQQFVSGIANKHIFSAKLGDIFNIQTLKLHFNIFMEFFGIIVVILAIFGFLFVLAEKKYRNLLPWIISMALEVLTICAIIKFEYYYIFFVPVTAMLSGIIYNEIFKRRKGKYILMSIAIAFLIIEAFMTKEKYMKVDEHLDHNINTIRMHKDADVPFGINYASPVYIDALKTEGARIGLNHFDNVPKDKTLEIEYWIDEGIKNFVLLKPWGSTEEFSKILDNYGRIIYEDENLFIYRIE
ncbi:hypothetical protein HKO22_06810 [Peptoniphilus sp. AGMB00490]|uniref:Glycosyltransferase RgtA/B/C/D-like domain-containing protein n=1 Tax=Peptoniphilus faecalis TaxID=2731255 RepID=A0A848RMD1_9FIRM|nr:glycosyltransferase family 39 protein [Peptoniphilus faecalis]NMW85442.1 hypothetical protein [Peptoniphilus faecalis]